MELSWIQIGVVGGLGTIVGLIISFFVTFPYKPKKTLPQGNFTQIHKSIVDAQLNLIKAQETLNKLLIIFEEVSELKYGKKNKPVKKYEEPRFE